MEDSLRPPMQRWNRYVRVPARESTTSTSKAFGEGSNIDINIPCAMCLAKVLGIQIS